MHTRECDRITLVGVEHVYIIKFTSTPYTLQQDLNMNGKVIFYGGILCEGTYYSVSGYTLMNILGVVGALVQNICEKNTACWER